MNNVHVIVHIGKNSGPDIIAGLETLRFAGAATQKSAAFGQGSLDMLLHAPKLDGADQWPDMVALCAGVANRLLPGGFLGDLQYLFITGALNQKTRRCVTGLARVVETLEH